MVTPRKRQALSFAEVRLLAAVADLHVPEQRLVSICNRLQAMREGARVVEALPLRDVEPAAVFRPDMQTD